MRRPVRIGGRWFAVVVVAFVLIYFD